MIKLLFVFILVSSAYGYGGTKGGYGAVSSAGYGSYDSGSATAGLSRLSSTRGYGSGLSYGTPQVVQAAIQTRHQVRYIDMPVTQEINPTAIEVNAIPLPLTILFRSSSSALNVQQIHNGAQGSVQESSSEDEPHRLVHHVTKPIVQEVHEVIAPSRKITQEIQPVQEEVLTVVARGQEQVQAAPAVIQSAPAVVQTAPAVVQTAPAVVQTAPAVVQTAPAVVPVAPALASASPTLGTGSLIVASGPSTSSHGGLTSPAASILASARNRPGTLGATKSKY